MEETFQKGSNGNFPEGKWCTNMYRFFLHPLWKKQPQQCSNAKKKEPTYFQPSMQLAFCVPGTVSPHGVNTSGVKSRSLLVGCNLIVTFGGPHRSTKGPQRQKAMLQHSLRLPKAMQGSRAEGSWDRWPREDSTDTEDRARSCENKFPEGPKDT